MPFLHHMSSAFTEAAGQTCHQGRCSAAEVAERSACKNAAGESVPLGSLMPPLRQMSRIVIENALAKDSGMREGALLPQLLVVVQVRRLLMHVL